MRLRTARRRGNLQSSSLCLTSSTPAPSTRTRRGTLSKCGSCWRTAAARRMPMRIVRPQSACSCGGAKLGGWAPSPTFRTRSSPGDSTIPKSIALTICGDLSTRRLSSPASVSCSRWVTSTRPMWLKGTVQRTDAVWHRRSSSKIRRQCTCGGTSSCAGACPTIRAMSPAWKEWSRTSCSMEEARARGCVPRVRSRRGSRCRRSSACWTQTRTAP
mmetsp:Transcript_28493/g.72071  ORF Transcript_28493/g.72071 Transcript_28493/m.72071 type:complete len:215 (+) Transcript_28493:431-1075(+)